MLCVAQLRDGLQLMGLSDAAYYGSALLFFAAEATRFAAVLGRFEVG